MRTLSGVKLAGEAGPRAACYGRPAATCRSGLVEGCPTRQARRWPGHRPGLVRASQGRVVWPLGRVVAQCMAEGRPLTPDSTAAVAAAEEEARLAAAMAEEADQGGGVRRAAAAWRLAVLRRRSLLTCLKQAVEQAVRQSSWLPDHTKAGLLLIDSEHQPSIAELRACNGHPPQPYTQLIAHVIQDWARKGRFPLELQPMCGLAEDNAWRTLADGNWTQAVCSCVAQLEQLLAGTALRMNVQEPYFSLLSDGSKSVEGRCAASPYRSLATGDQLLVNNSLMLHIQAVKLYKSFHDMLQAEGLTRVLPGVQSIEEGVAVYRKFYDEAIEASWGVAAIHVAPAESSKQPFCIVDTLLQELGMLGIRAVMRQRHTMGTVMHCSPPPRAVLLASFNQVHHPPNKLTVGAKAWTKHTHRSSDQWWGVSTGTDLEKNARAKAVVLNLVDNAVWMNTHLLPHDVEVYEVRVTEGYGARWSADGNEFRGFLEPQMPDGHAIGWRH